MRKLIRSKLGDIPITVLVIGVLAICTLVIFSFYSSNKNVKADFDSFGAVERAVVESEKILLYSELGFNDEEITELFNISVDEIGRKFIVISEEGIVVKRFISP